MKWSRDLRVARRTVRTAMKATTAMARASARLPQPLRAIPPAAQADGLTEINDFGSNPGRLAMFVYIPATLLPGSPLIVLLHGCGQSATRFAADTGWIAFADRFGIPLVLPEQSGENNRGRCFNWFRPMHVKRGFGEALSIRQMVDVAVQRFDADSSRVFIAGLSAGGAMAAASLAAYPDVYTGGAIVAGLPVGAASSTVDALARMADAGPLRPPGEWTQQARAAAPAGYNGPWPRVSIWHGSSDDVVDPANARLLAEQWSGLHALDGGTTTTEANGARRAIWGDPQQPVVELWTLPDLPHVWPPEAVNHVARFWQLHTG
jgi:feruloyl esterase